MLEDDVSFGGRGLSFSAPSNHNEWLYLTIENYWEKDASVARLQNMNSMSIMLHNRVMLCKKAGLQVPYGEAFVFGIELSFKPGRETCLNCGWVERDEFTQGEVYWVRTMCELPSKSLEDFERMRRSIKTLIECVISPSLPTT